MSAAEVGLLAGVLAGFTVAAVVVAGFGDRLLGRVERRMDAAWDPDPPDPGPVDPDRTRPDLTGPDRT